MALNSKIERTKKCPTGAPGLDDILFGGLPKDHLYLVQGRPGSTYLGDSSKIMNSEPS